MSHPHLTAAAAAGMSIASPAPSRQASSSQFSRSTSTFGFGNNAAAGPSSSATHLTAMHAPAPEREGLRALLKGMVHAPKYAVFDVTVSIEALEQVPQTEGMFEARWKFNGKSPAGKEAAKLSHKASMPDMRSPGQPPLPSAAQSTISLRSSNTSLSSGSSPTASLHPATTGRAPTATPAGLIHSPLSMTAAHAQSHTPPNGSPPRIGKKASDPTPLRQSSRPSESEGEKEKVVESPTEMQQHIDLNSPANSPKNLAGAAGPSKTASVPSPQRTDAFDGQPGGALRINTGLPVGATRSTSQVMNLPDTSMRSFSSNMAQRTARTATVPAPIRSGTGPSPAVLLGVPPLGHGDRPDIMVRSPTNFSTTSASSSHGTDAEGNGQGGRQSLDGAPMSALSGQSSQSAASGSQTGTKHAHHAFGLGRSRTRGSAHENDKNATGGPAQNGSDHRKGVTPSRKLRQHACSWNYAVRHTIKIPMGKPVAATPMHSGSATPNPSARKEMAPILGGGQHSESGFLLIINEIRTHNTTSVEHGHSKGPPSTAKDREHEKGEIQHIVDEAAKAVKDPVKAATHGAIKEQRLVFGTVEFDLAQFAGKGKVNRRFLLRGSRTNAVVAVRVELQQVGGETHWAAPPLQEGHHVTTSDFTGGGSKPTARAPELTLNRNSSNSSSEMSISCSNTSASRSNLNIAGMRPRSHSDVSLNNAPAKVGYKGYEHHLKPTDGPAGTGRAKSRRGRSPKTPPDSPSMTGRSPSVAPLDSPGYDVAPDTLPPLSPSTSSHARRDSVLPYDRTRRVHRHHSIHLRNFAHTHGSLFGGGTESPGGRHGHSHSHRRGHGHGSSNGIAHGVVDLAPELVIEGIFNPKQGFEDGPMTMGPDHVLPNALDVPMPELDEGEQDENGIITIGSSTPVPTAAQAKRKTWGLRRGPKKEKEQKGEQWVIASMHGTTAPPQGYAPQQEAAHAQGQGGAAPQTLLPPGGYRDDAEVRSRRGGLADMRTESTSTLRAFHIGHGIAGGQRTPVGTA